VTFSGNVRDGSYCQFIVIFVNASKRFAKLPSQITKDHIFYDSI